MQHRKVLIVDDEAYLTEVVALKLQRAGYTVLIARDGEDGFAIARTELPDLIVSDYQMPVLSGVEMAMRLKQDSATREIPVLMLTARGHRIDENSLSQTNVRFILTKPFSSRELLEKVGEMLSPTGKASAA